MTEAGNMSEVNQDMAVTAFVQTVSSESNYAFAAIYIACMVLGIPGNVMSLRYFLSLSRRKGKGGNKEFFNNIYILIVITDLLICFTLLPNVLTFLNGREGIWFSSKVFCNMWGCLWEILPFLSVYFVGFMSISRTMVLVRPLARLQHQSLWIITSVYTLFLLLRTIVPVILNKAAYEFGATDAFCFEVSATPLAYKFNATSRVLTLAVPIIPICISCFISFTIVQLTSRKRMVRSSSSASSTGVHSPHAATVTIVMFTIVYIIFNIPVFINYLLMTIAGMSGNCSKNCYSIKYMDNFILTWYSWNFTYVMCVALNSTCNPVIYYLRMKQVKEYVDEKIRKSSRIMVELGHQARYKISMDKTRFSEISRRSTRDRISLGYTGMEDEEGLNRGEGIQQDGSDAGESGPQGMEQEQSLLRRYNPPSSLSTVV